MAVLKISTFAPEPYLLRRPIEVEIEQVEDNFMASLLDTNISASGDNQEEAFDCVKDLILDIYESLRAEPTERLGPEPQRQLAFLESLLEKG